MFAVRVKPSEARRSRHGYGSEVWVQDAESQFYVPADERGLWATREEARAAIREPWEVVVEISDETSEELESYDATDELSFDAD